MSSQQSNTTVGQERFFAIVPTEVLYHPDLNGSDIRVYASLSDRAGRKGHAWPGMRRMARDLGMNIKTVRAATLRLEEAGVIEITRSVDDSGQHQVNEYWLPGVVPKRTQGGPKMDTGPGPKMGTELDPVGTRPMELDLAKPRNEIWDALAVVFGEPTTKTNTTLRGKVTASLKSAGATADDVAVRVSVWPLHFPDMTLTETALEKHWDRLGREPLKANETDVRRVQRRMRAKQLGDGE